LFAAGDEKPEDAAPLLLSERLSHPVNITVRFGNSKPFQLLYSCNKTGTVATVTGNVNGANVNERYTYDPLQRLVNALVKTGSTTTTPSYTYDALGNRKSQTLKPQPPAIATRCRTTSWPAQRAAVPQPPTATTLRVGFSLGPPHQPVLTGRITGAFREPC